MPSTNASLWTQGNNRSLTGIHRQFHKTSLRIWQSFDDIFLPILYDSPRHPSEAISTSLRPAVNPLLGCSSGKPVQDQLANFFSTAFDPRAWTLVVFWKEDSGRHPQLITPENGGDETNYPSPPTFTSFDDWAQGTSRTSCTPGPPGPPGVPPGWPPAPSPAGDRERERDPEIHRVSGYFCDLHHPEPQLIPIPLIDGDDDQPPQEERQRSEYTLIHKSHRYHKFNLWLLQNLMMYQMKTFHI